MRYLSVCSGIEAATVAWHPIGWEAAAFSEIEAFPRSVLAHHYPDTPCHGDFTTIEADQYGPIDLLVGGTPCQSFSVAGLRKGLADERGNLALEYLRLADRIGARWLVWENVPGVLSSSGGRDFGAFLGGLAQLGYGFAYRVLDAQFFGVPQRRRRVFVVGHLGDWRRAAAVLFERHSLSGHPTPRREKGPSVAALTANGVGTCGADDNQGQAGHLVARSVAIRGRDGVPQVELGDEVANAILTPNGGRGGIGVGAVLETFDRQSSGEYGTEPVASTVSARDYKSPSDLIAFTAKDHGADAQDDLSPTLRAGGHSGSHANAGVIPYDFFQITAPINRQNRKDGDPCHTLAKDNASYATVQTISAVRRLTPRECERLQGFPDTQKSVIITVCEAANSDSAKSAQLSLAAPSRGQREPVAVRVLIDLERQHLLLLRADGSSWSASTAEKPSSSPLSMPLDAFVALAAHTIISLVPATGDGLAASPAPTQPFIHRWSGSASVRVSGREIAALAGDAARFGSEASRLSRFTTSPHGHDTQIAEQTLQTWSCCVLAAINGFIPAEIRSAGSYTAEVVVEAGYTLVPHRGKPAADGPRYKALGNSMAVPVMRWIGERIAMVEAIAEQRAAA